MALPSKYIHNLTATTLIKWRLRTNYGHCHSLPALLTVMIFSQALRFFPFPLIVSSQGEHIEIQSNLVTLLINTFLCILSKIKVLIIASNTYIMCILSYLSYLGSSFTPHHSHLPPVVPWKCPACSAFRAFLSALPGTFFLTLLSDSLLHLLQVSVCNLLEKPFLIILLFILLSVCSICSLSVYFN